MSTVAEQWQLACPSCGADMKSTLPRPYGFASAPTAQTLPLPPTVIMNGSDHSSALCQACSYGATVDTFTTGDRS